MEAGNQGPGCAPRGAATRGRGLSGRVGRLAAARALLFVAGVLAAGSAHAQAPAHCNPADPNEIWCSTITVEEDDPSYGWRKGVRGSLDIPNVFDYEGVFHAPEYLDYEAGGPLFFVTDRYDDSFASGFKLILGSVEISLDGAWDAGKGEYAVENHGLSWSDGDMIEVKLVRLPPPPPLIVAIPDQTAMVGTAFSFQFADDLFTSPNSGPLTYSARQYNGTALPSWLSFAAGTRTFSGTPQSGDVGRVPVRVTATDQDRRSSSDTFDIVVSSKPSVSGTARVGQTLTSVTNSTDSFTYQWIRVDGTTETEISGATSSTYTLVAADLGKKVKAKVSFTVNSVATEAKSDAYPPHATVQPATFDTADLAGRREVWGGTLTAGAHRAGGRTEVVGYGWSRLTGSLTHLEDAISLGANSYRVGSNVMLLDQTGDLVELLAVPPGSLVFGLIGSGDQRNSAATTQELTATEKAALRLHVGNRTFDFSAATLVHGESYEWQTPNLFWLEGDSIPLKLSLPTSFMEQVAADPPTVDDTPGVSGAGNDGTWTEGESVDVTVTFSEEVDVDTAGGTPSIGIGLGGTASRSAAYVSGSGTTELVFRYTLVGGDGSHTDMAVTPDSLALGGGTIRSVATDVDAVLAHNGTVVQGSGTRNVRPTAEFQNVPKSHDEATTFKVGLRFSGAPAGLNAQQDATSVLEVTGGSVTGARESSKGANPDWEVTVAPDSMGDVTVRVPVRACSEANAVCIGGQALADAAEAVVPGPPFTASFTEAPAAHDGASDFDLQLAFSHKPAAGFSYRTVEDALFDIEGGALTRVWRREGGKNRLWGITITPGGDDAVTLAARATTDCAASHAVCDAEGRKFAGGLTATIPGPEVSEPADPITASWSSKPNEHDGTSPFDLHLDFSRAPVNFSDRAITGGVVSVEGGQISRVWGRVQGQDDQWGIEVTPSGTDDVTVSVNETTDCAAQHAVCAADGGMLEGGAQAVIPGPPADPITASWSSKPDEHDGTSPFDLHLDFSRAPVNFSYRAIMGGVVSVQGGGISRVWRRTKGQNDQWGVEVTPSGTDGVTVSVNETTDCAAQHAVCAADGGMLEGGAQAVIQGPALLSVADARVEENQGATLDFVVSLSRSRNEETTVEYATSDDTAHADEDYTADSGTLTFAANERSRTVSVTVLDDEHDEGEETLTLRLSNASGAGVADGEATGTIENRDPLPRALLARFGRTAAVHVVEHVEERLQASRKPGFRGRFAGRELRRGMERDVALNFVSRLGGMAGVSPLRGGVAGSPGAGMGSVGTPGLAGGAAMGAAAPPGAMAGTMGATALGASGVGAVASPMGAAARPAGGFFNRGGLLQMGLGGGDLLTGSDFALNRESRGGILSFWSRGARSHFAGRDGTLGLNGDVRTTMFGADYARGPIVAGLSLSHSRGLGEYAGVASGQVLSSVTGLYPWLGYKATERITVWGVGGYGGGGLLLTPQGGTALESGLSMKMAAAGTRGELVASGASGFALAFKADALWVGTSIEGVDGPAGRLAATDAAVTRFRTGLESSRAYTVAGRLSLTPSVEVGLRHDGGDAETGAGMDVGAGLVVSDSSTGLSLDVRVRTLLVHQAEGFSERGVAWTFSYNPTPSTPLGFTARVAPSWGGEARSGAEALWGRETMAGMAHGSFAQGNRLDGEVGYGLPAGSRFVGTPRVGFSASEYGRDYRVGYGLGVLKQGNTKFELGVDAQRREKAMRGGASNGILVRATVGW